MICLDIQERLSAYLDGDLSPEEMEEVSEHLCGCEACQTVLSELRQVRDELGSLPEVEIPEDLHFSIMQSLKPHMKPKKRTLFNLDFRSWGYRQWVPVTAAAMVLVMFLSAGGVLALTGRMGKNDGLFGAMTEASSPEGSRGVAGAPWSKTADSVAPSDSADYANKGSGEPQMAMVAPNGTYGGTGTAAETLLESARKIIRRAQLELEVSRGGVKPASDEAVRVVQANSGYVESSSLTEGDTSRKEITSYFLVARVPSANLDQAVEGLTGLGRTTRNDTSAQDITDVYVDLDARLRNKENQESRLLQIMGQAQTVGELLQVEGEVSRVRGDIESMRAQKVNYDKAVDLSTITLTIGEEGAAKPTSPSPWSEVWRVFVEAWRNLLLLAAQIAPAVIVVAAIAAGGIWIARRRRA